MEVFAISPATSKPLWFLAVICLLLAVIFTVLAYTAYSARNSRVQIDADGLRLVGDFWARTIPLEALDVAAARVLDLDRETEYSPKRRTLGTGLPGYASGWFRLHNGEKALIYLTRRQPVVHVPTSDGYALLLSVEKPDKFIEALKRRAP
jgi:hypothetical protein